MFWWLGCAAFLPAEPLPPHVREILPIPPGAALEDAECVGAAGAEGYTCGGHATVALPMRAAADDAARRMAGWQEYSWDEVPGRIQYSWRRGPEWVSLAAHELPAGTRLSLSYNWSERGDEPDLDRWFEPGPLQVAPPGVAAVGLPEGAVLLGAGDTWGVWSFTGDADAWLARAAEGRSVQMRSRGEGRRALIVGDDTWAWHVVVKLGAEQHRLRVDASVPR